MGTRQFISPIKKKILLELFKAHYTPTEAAEILKISYAVTSTYFRAFKVANTPQYNRSQLLPGDIINDIEFLNKSESISAISAT